MKILLLIIGIFLTSHNLSKSQVDGVVNALNRGNAVQLSSYFNSNIQIDLGDKKISYSKSQAQLVLRDFFSSNTVKNFEVLRLTDASNPVKYCIGNLNTVNGLYHTSIYLKHKGDHEMIEEIDFEK